MKSIKEILTEARGNYPEWLYDEIHHGMLRGWIYGDDSDKTHNHYAFTEENYKTLFLDVTKEQVEKCAKDVMKREKIDFLYKTNDEARKDWPKHHNVPLLFEE